MRQIKGDFGKTKRACGDSANDFVRPVGDAVFLITDLVCTKRDIGKIKRDIGKTKRDIGETKRAIVSTERDLVISERGLVFSERAKKITSAAGGLHRVGQRLCGVRPHGKESTATTALVRRLFQQAAKRKRRKIYCGFREREKGKVNKE